MTETYIGGRDAYVAGNVATSKVKPRGSYRAPAYTDEFTRAGTGGGQSLGEYQATLARLAKLGPGYVKRMH